MQSEDARGRHIRERIPRPNDEAHPPLEPWVSELPPGVFPEELMTMADVVHLHHVRCRCCGDALWSCDCDEGGDHHGTDDDVCQSCRDEALP